MRRVALRGAAADGVALSRADLVPEVTITARGVYWHPVGADDDDMRVTESPFPLAAAFEAMREALRRERALNVKSGRTTSSITLKPPPSSRTRSSSFTSHASSVIGFDALARMPSALQPPETFRPVASPLTM